MRRRQKRNLIASAGFGLIEVLVSIGLVAILAGILTSVILNTLKVQKSLDEKFVLLDTKNFLINAFANSSVCASQLGVQMMNLAATTTTVPYGSDVSYSILRSGDLPNSPIIAQTGIALPGTKMIIQSIKLKNILKVGTGDSFQGLLEVAIDLNTMSLPRKPITMPILFTASTPLTSATIISCSALTSNFKGAPYAKGWSSGTYNGDNKEGYPIMVTANGGNSPGSGDSTNPCHLQARVSGIIVAETRDNNPQYAKFCSISFWVPADETYKVFSSPYPNGNGKFNVIENR
jgi:type II secretory pathway pseudopilin PulG